MRTLLRWLFAALVLANVGIAMWASWYRIPAAPQPKRPLPQIHPERMVPLLLPQIAPASRAPTPTSARKRGSATVVTVTKVVAPPVRQCFAIGPFDTVSEVQQAGAWLKSAGISYATRTRVDKVASSYWVYLPPLASRAAAMRMLRELDLKGIKNHIIVQQPGQNYAISLGLYDLPKNAHTRLAELVKKGVHAKQKIRYRSRTRYWLDVEVVQADEHARLQSRDWGAAGAALQDTSCAPVPVPSASPAPKSEPKSEPLPQASVTDHPIPENPLPVH